MKKFSVLLLLFLSCDPIFAQQYVPFPAGGAVWRESFSDHSGFPPSGYSYHIKQEHDTFIGSIKYILLSTVEKHAQRDQFGNFTYFYSKGLFGAMREDANKRVFYYDLKEDKEHLLYDFNMQVGDTLPEYIRYSEAFTISSVDSVLIGNSYRKRYRIGDIYNGFIIEGIGSAQGLKNKITVHFEVFSDLECFSINGIRIYPDSNRSCELLISVEEEKRKAVYFNVFPNPTTENFTIQTQSIFQDCYICIRDIFGRIIKTEKLISTTSTINMSGFAKGIYFVELRNESGSAVQKLVVE